MARSACCDAACSKGPRSVEGSAVYLYVALAITLLSLLGYLLYLNGRLAALRRERDALERSDGWPDESERDTGSGRTT